MLSSLTTLPKVALVPTELYSEVITVYDEHLLNFHHSVMMSSKKLPYYENAIPISNLFCTKIDLKEQQFRK